MPKFSLLERIIYVPPRLNLNKLQAALQGKTVVITGASSGIGEQLAYLLASCRVHLVLVARREEKLASMKRKLADSPAQISLFHADLRNEEELEQLLSYLHRLPGGLDIVVSNAGHSIRRPIMESLDRYHDFTRTMSINYFAPVRLLLSIIPLLERKRGHIINSSTINTSLVPFPHWAAYQSSKTAFDTWLRSAAPELEAAGISATSVYFPLVRTPMIAPTAIYADKPAMSAEHAARIIATTMLTKRRSWTPWWLIFGQLASLLGRGIWERSSYARLRKRGE